MHLVARQSCEVSLTQHQGDRTGCALGNRAAVDLVARIRAGLTDPERPFATYLFTGPTGTGKTQMAKALAGFLYGDESRLVRVDMGEMTGPESVARLIGDRYDPRGLLTNAVRQQPFSVVLLDEARRRTPRCCSSSCSCSTRVG